jgi:ribosomal protein S18 acetylase RimI-like enzyme
LQLTTHAAYRVLVATLDSRLLGFAVLHTDRLSSLPSRWKRAFWPQLALFAVKHPWFVAGRVSNVVSRQARRRVHLGTGVDAREEFRESVYLDDIAVSDAARGQGIGRMLLEACVDETRRLGLATLKLTVDEENEAAIRLYRKMGFEETSRNEKHQTRIYSADVREPTVSTSE